MNEQLLTQQHTTGQNNNQDTGSGFGSMQGNSISKNSADVLSNNNGNTGAGTTLSNDSGKEDKWGVFSGEDPITEISDYDLISMLHNIWFFDKHILTYYVYEKKLDCQNFDYDYLINYYNLVFSNGDKTPTTAYIDEFYRRVDEKGGVEEYKKGIKDEYLKTQVDDIWPTLKEPGILNRLKTDGDALMETAQKVKELNPALSSANNDIKEYNKIKKKAQFLYLTQADVDQVSGFKTTAENFVTIYNSANTQAKSCYADDYQRITGAITAYTDFLKDAPDVVKKSVQKILDMGKNPLPAPDGSDYVKPGKKEENKDKPNKRMLKSWDIYKQVKKEGQKEKVEEYSIYKKDKKKTDANEIDINDAVQGSLGDCYLISSIAAVARQRPDLIRSLIDYKQGEPEATVTLYMLNPDTNKYESKEIKVSLDFPVKDGMPGYAKQGDGELWVMLIEKAYAQEMGGYANIEAQSPSQALAVLTGVEPTPTATDANNLVDQLKTANDPNRAVVAGTKKEGDIKALADPACKVEQFNGSPLVRLSGSKEKIYPEHAYTVLSYDEVNKTVKLRNPHGNKSINYVKKDKLNGDSIESEWFPAEFSITLDEFKACFSTVYSSNLSK